MDIPEPSKKFRRVAKPVMEKRRRDRINHSLETLRLLLSENNEKLKSPKVEKAEILESVVNFLRAEQAELQSRSKARKRAWEEEEDVDDHPHKRQMYCDGMRTCLLRVSHFITTKSKELESGLEWKHLAQKRSVTTTTPPHDPRSLSPRQQSGPGSPARCLSAAPTQCAAQETKATYLATKDMAVQLPNSLVFSDCVWRPWPQ